MKRLICLWAMMLWISPLQAEYHPDRGQDDIRYLGVESYQDILIQNWAGNVSFTPDKIFYPKTVDEVQRIIKDAYQKKFKISMIGKGHSWNPLMHGSDYLISTKDLKGIHIDPEALTATVQAGATIKEVDIALSNMGLVFPCNVVGTSDLTYGGVMATGSHGSGRSCGVMSDYIESMEIIDSKGNLKLYSDETVGSETMKYAKISLGMLGFIYKITFKVVKNYQTLVTDRYVTMDNLMSELQHTLKTQDAVEVLWFPYTDKVLIKSRVKTERPLPEPGRFSSIKETVKNEAFYYFFHYGLFPLMNQVPASTPYLIRTFAKMIFPESQYVTDINSANHYFDEGHRYPINESEIAIPFDLDDMSPIAKGWFAMVDQVKEEARTGQYRLNIIVHMRFIAGSTLPMSPSYGNTNTCYMDFGNYFQTPGWFDISEKIWRTWKEIPGVKLHWAKDMINFGDIDVRSMYGEQTINKFLDLRQAMDPDGMFTNAHMKKMFRI